MGETHERDLLGTPQTNCKLLTLQRHIKPLAKHSTENYRFSIEFCSFL